MVTIRQPAYTGANRCWPCTAGNALILVVMAVAVAFWSPVGAILVGSFGAVAIWQRGYLLPYTPSVAPAILARLGISSPANTPPDGEGASLEDVGGNASPSSIMDALLDRRILVEQAGSIEPSTEFATQWSTAMNRLADLSPSSLAAETAQAAHGAESARAVCSEHDRWYIVLDDGSGRVVGETWIRQPKAIAETAAVQVLRARDVPERMRPPAASALCLFLSACPVCGGTVEEQPAGGCCGPPMRAADGGHKTALVCQGCGTHLHVFE